MPSHNNYSDEHFAEQLACADYKGKTKVDPSGGSGTHKTDGGVSKLEYWAQSKEVITIDSSSDSFSDEDWSFEDPEFGSDELLGKVAQVKSDEILARRLQEEIYKELTDPEGDEELLDDSSHVVGALQEEGKEIHDCDSNITSITRHNFDVNQMNLPPEPLTLNGQHFLLQVSPMQSSNLRRPELRFSGPEMEYEMWLLSQIRKGLCSSEMDPATTSELLKELEAIYESRNDVDMHDSFHPGFYEDEYEYGSTADELVGATDSQINNLPISTVKGDKVEDMCVICLEVPSAGAVVRHLPCMHKFHEKCIDLWLRRRNSCPICKAVIN